MADDDNILTPYINGTAYQPGPLPTAQQVASLPIQPLMDPVPGRPMAISPGVSLQQNMQDARDHFLNLKWFYDQVHNSGPWDYKQQDQSRYHDAGNFNYGATGAALGLPQWVLDRAAGFVQKQDHPGDTNPGSWYGSAPYGDDPNSQAEINQGIAYARGHPR